MSTRMQQRRGTASQWVIANPILAEGEFGWESDSNKFKIGDGVNNWSTLGYFEDATAISGSLSDYVEIISVGAPDGVASLDANGTLTITELPASVATTSYVDSAVSTLIDAAPGALDTLNELAAALNDDANFFTTIGTQITTGDSTTLTSAQNYADGLAVNYDSVGSADAAEAAANSYTDAEVIALDTALKTYADQAETDAVTTANSYTDAEIAAIPAVDLAGYALETYVDTALANLVDTAPSTLDTLNELAAALNDDANAFTTLTAYADQAEADAITASNSYTDSAVASAQPTFTNNFMLMGA